jgi:hypothetical protein
MCRLFTAMLFLLLIGTALLFIKLINSPSIMLFMRRRYTALLFFIANRYSHAAHKINY